MLFTKRPRFAIGRSRSGISSLIGAIFFVLVVFLIFTSTVLIFDKFTGYASAFKQVNQDDVQAKDTVASISNLDFGGVVPASVIDAGDATLNTGSPTMSLLPVQNMNFTDNMNGWTFSRDYELALHDGTITNYPLNVLPGVDVFLLDVSNTDPMSVSSAIEEVQLAVNPSFDVPKSLQTAPAGWCVTVTPPPSPGAPAVISWIVGTTNPSPPPTCTPASPAVCDTSGIQSPALMPVSNSLTFAWTAVLPAVLSSYTSVVTLTWEDVNTVLSQCVLPHQPADTTFQTTVVTTNTGQTAMGQIVAEPSGTVPGGASGGYDGTSTTIGSESGPGSLFLDYQPAFNGNPITSPDQLTSIMNFTTYFTLNSALTPGATCCTLSYGFSLDKDVSSSIVSLSSYLVLVQPQVPTCAPATDIELLAESPSLIGTGWQMNDLTFSPATLEAVGGSYSGELCAGLYELVLSVGASMIGPTPLTPSYPATLQMHFDDIGLALQEPTTAYYSDSARGIALPTSQLFPSEIQSVLFSAQLAQGTSGNNVTAYAYLENIQTSTNASAPNQCSVLPSAFCHPSWVELGQVTFTSSATISTVIPGATASQFIDEYNSLCRAETSSHALTPSGMCVRIYAVSSGNFVDLDANVSVVVQTWQPQLGTVLVTNNSTAPVHLVGLYISGPDGVQSNTELGTVSSGLETSASQTVLTDASATWTPGQWDGYYLQYTTGPDAGQSLLIISNTATQITTASFALVPTANDRFQINGGGIWVGGGQQVAIPIGDQLPTQLYPFTWATGQTYVATVTTSTGIVLTGTFVAP